MLSVQYPQVAAYLENNFHAGLLPLKFVKDLKIKLVVKASKEAVLAAKINQEIKIYLVPLVSNGMDTFSLITTFEDNAEDPLTITTPLFEEELSHYYKELLLYEKVEIYFFDENNVELLAYEAEINCPDEIKTEIENRKFVPFKVSVAKEFLDEMATWFVNRSKNIDSQAITLKFKQSLMPDDIFIMDARPHINSYVGSGVTSLIRLERAEPGAYQERDIVRLLQRVFSSSQIYLNPLRTYDKEEIADVLVIGRTGLLFIQAKDSPNTEKILKNSISRKRATALKNLKKALRQVGGAVNYATKNDVMEFFVGERKFSVRTKDQIIRTLVVTKELFLEDCEEYTSIVMSTAAEIGRVCLPLDYFELHSHTMNLKSEEDLFSVFDQAFDKAKENGIFPKIRFGFADKKDM